MVVMAEVVVILHNIRSTHNVGAILRTADGFGVQHCYFTGYTPYPSFSGDRRLPHIANKIHAAIHKTALGAEASVPFTVIEDVASCISQLRGKGFRITGLEQDARSVSIYKMPHDGKIALLLGEEVEGINSELRELCDLFIEIPMKGKKESFNVSIAAAIAMYEATRS